MTTAAPVLCGCNGADGTNAWRRCRHGLFGVCGAGSPCAPVVDASTRGPGDKFRTGGLLGVHVPPVPALGLAAPALVIGQGADWPDRLIWQLLLWPIVESVAAAPVPEPTFTVMLTLTLVPPRGVGGTKLAVLPVEAGTVAALPPCACIVDGAKLAELLVEGGQVAEPLCLASRASACSPSASVANGLCRTIKPAEVRLVLLAALTNLGVVR